jgi:sigma-E factor negative regulatory protein RseC
MEEIGIVKVAEGSKAIVMVKRHDGCEACAAGASCKAAHDGAEVEAFNAVHAKAGDTVKISFRAFTYLKGTLIMYGVPALALVVGVVVGKEYMSNFFPTFDADLVSAIVGGGFVIVAVVGIRILIRKYSKRKDLVPIIEEIVQKGH